MIPSKEKILECYHPLIDHFREKYDIIISISGIEEIEVLLDKVNKNLHELWRVFCDVKGCNETASGQGIYWKNSGHWCLCSKHMQVGREGKRRPIMKKEAIKREKSRNYDGILP